MKYIKDKASTIKVGAYITSYKDTCCTQKIIGSLLLQSHKIDFVFIVDNSPSDLKLVVPVNHTIKYCPENIGVAGGLNIAIQWFLNKKYDFLWIFDQDSLPEFDTLKILLKEFDYLQSSKIPVGIISPAIVDVQTKSLLLCGYRTPFKLNWQNPNQDYFYREKLYQCDVVITSGSLINLQAAKNIPLPNPDLFIDGVDWEYCLNMKKHGYHVCVSEKTTMQHNFGTYLTHLNQNHPIYIYSSLRYYYINRNHTYIETRLSNNPYYKTLSYLHRLQSLIKKIGKIIIYEPDQKLIKIWASCLGFYHGLIGKLGKTWLP
ncbi:glycosyltransferase [Synechocystis sp. PCC 7339]|uniref:glycosyltransferase n=1 Tax=unclassified Synechocystis TaxID=2640012 RepID=UPI001BB0C2CB|nr:MULTISPECIES: glycosyltransferase [unclassified Synechocystis]QUS59310.1 glycosyltransferase [Synechocystis sp. PCC 7338]UAJ71496.1 glycosyltransferase [Synechocystis sp. PCC 7339]